MSYTDDLVLLAKEEIVLQGVTDNCKVLWNRNKCGKKLSNEKFEATIPSTDYDRSKTTGQCGMKGVYAKLNP
jgi:hypothetical protein